LRDALKFGDSIQADDFRPLDTHHKYVNMSFGGILSPGITPATDFT
jgi:hypothetical protein